MRWTGWIAAMGFLAFFLLGELWRPQTETGPLSPTEESSKEEALRRRIAELEDEMERLRASARESGARILLTPLSTTEEVASEASMVRPAPLQRSKPFGQIQGHLWSKGYVPLGGVPIQVEQKTRWFRAETRSDAEGFYAIPLPPGEYQIQCDFQSGRASAALSSGNEWIVVEAGSTAVKDFLLGTPLIRIPVLDRITRRPILDLDHWPSLEGPANAEGEHEEFHAEGWRDDGVLSFLELPEGIYKVKFDSDRYRPPEGQEIAIFNGQAEQPILLEEKALVRLCLVDAAGKPYAKTIGVERKRKDGSGDGHEAVFTLGEGGNLGRRLWSQLQLSFVVDDGARRILVHGGNSIHFLNPSEDGDGCHFWHAEEGDYAYVFHAPNAEGEMKPFLEFDVRVPRTGVVPLRVVAP